MKIIKILFMLPVIYSRPNIIFYLADDLGQGEINQQNNNYSFNVNKLYSKNIINTPNLETFAKQSTSFYHVWSSSVCAPSRYTIITGKISEYADVKGNVYLKNKVSFEKSFPRELNNIGYKTGLIGKYGFGDVVSPLDIGFDYYFGYDTHVDAHYPYPVTLRNNRGYTTYPKNRFASKTKCFSEKCVFAGDVFLEKSLNFIRENRNNSFFLLWTPTSNHAGYWKNGNKYMSYPVSSFGEYKNKLWSNTDKMHAYSTSTLDRDIGLVTNLLKELDIEKNTIVVFASDNGVEFLGKNNNEKSKQSIFFNGAGGRKGEKRSVYEGGINVPVMIKWLDNIPQGLKNYYPWAFHDFAVSFLDIVGADKTILADYTKSSNITYPVSMKNIWKGSFNETNRSWLLSEYCEPNFCKYSLMDVRNWNTTLPKLVFDNGYEFYDIINDPEEKYNLTFDNNFNYMLSLVSKF
jgi:arylsulfatase A